MPGQRGGAVKNRKQYVALKEKGMSKERAARIANSFSNADVCTGSSTTRTIACRSWTHAEVNISNSARQRDFKLIVLPRRRESSVQTLAHDWEWSSRPLLGVGDSRKISQASIART